MTFRSYEGIGSSETALPVLIALIAIRSAN